MTATSKSGLAPVPGGQLYFESAGQGPAIVFIHAAIADRRMWNREFELYAKDRTVVRYDVRGLGRSPPATDAYSDVDDLRSLLEYLKIPSATIVGCSNGGRIALDFALEHPHTVNALLLVAAGVSGFDLELAPEGKPVFEEDMARSSKIPAAWAAGRKDEALEALRQYWTSAQEGANAELVRTMMRENAGEIFSDASARHNRALDPPAAARLKSIQVPTVVLQGDRDEPSMTFISRYVAREIPHARFVPVPGADHLVNLSRPTEFDRALRELLGRVP
jgi:3-oxoadipate enol-lactonase